MYDLNALNDWLNGASPGEEFIVTEHDIANMSRGVVEQFNNLLNTIRDERGTAKMRVDYKLTTNARGYVLSKVK